MNWLRDYLSQPDPEPRVEVSAIPPVERLRRSVLGRTLQVHVSEGLEMRLRAHIDRCERELARAGLSDDDPMDPNSDVDLAVALAACAERGLAEGERDDGLEGMMWGEIFSAEQIDEFRRRRPR
jgi:hypothetical protein